MIRSALGKVAWVGRTASMVFGLALVLALVVGAASMAFGANGQSFLLGKWNAATALTGLSGNVNGAAMQVANSNAGADDTALSLSVQAGEAPMRVNSKARVAHLNAATAGRADSAASADNATNAGNANTLDNKDSSELLGMEATLQPGQTLTGVFAASSGATSGIYNTAVGFRPKLPADIDDAHFHYLANGQTSAECPGYGQAAAGHLCFYPAWSNAVTFSGAWPANSSFRAGNESDQLGTALYFTSTGTGSNVRGTWAVTAPQATLQSQQGAQEQPAGESQSTPMGRVAR